MRKSFVRHLNLLIMSLLIFPICSQAQELSQQQKDKLVEAAILIHDKSLSPIDANLLVETAIKAMTELADSRTKYYPAKNYQEQIDEFDGNDFGTGIVIQKQAEQYVIAYISKDSPAHKAGINAYTQLLAINNISVNELNLKDIRKLLDEGAYQSEVSVTVDTNDGPHTVLLQRTAVPKVDIDITFDDRHIYLDFSYFNSQVDEQVSQWLATLPESTKHLPIIIDVQWVKGGSIKATSRTAKLFLSQGSTSTKMLSRDNQIATRYTAKHDGKYHDRQIKLLVNHRTQSSAEMFMAALQGQPNVTVYGSRTYGKGTVQTFYDLNDGSGLLITTKQMVTPKSNQPWHEKGIYPDYPYIQLIK